MKLAVVFFIIDVPRGVFLSFLFGFNLLYVRGPSPGPAGQNMLRLLTWSGREWKKRETDDRHSFTKRVTRESCVKISKLKNAEILFVWRFNGEKDREACDSYNSEQFQFGRTKGWQVEEKKRRRRIREWTLMQWTWMDFANMLGLNAC